MRKHTGRGEGTSGLTFDSILPQPFDPTPAPRPVLDPGHTAIELDAPPFPAIDLVATPDAREGWNLHGTVQNFTVDPENASTVHVPGAGHIHLRVGGMKVTRVYSERFHLPPIPVGEHELVFELRANDHSPFLVDGQVVRGAAIIVQPATVPPPPAGTVDLAPATAPTVALDVRNDPIKGYNLRIETTNFTCAPANASSPHVASEGHARLFVGGDQLARVYGEWFYLPALAVGSHQVRVELVANDHRTYTVGGLPIEDIKEVTVTDSR